MDGKGSVLVVDDEPLLALAYQQALDLCGFEATSTDSPVEAAALIDETTYDVVILDVVMPVLSGLALLERVHARDTHTAVILITGVVDEASAGAAVGRAFRWLHKPVSAERLCAVVAQGVEQAREDRQGRQQRATEDHAVERHSEDTARLILHRDGNVSLGGRFWWTLLRAAGAWFRRGLRAGLKTGIKKAVVALLIALMGMALGQTRLGGLVAKWLDRLGVETKK